MVDFDALIDEAVVYGEMEAGTDPRWLARQTNARLVATMAKQRTRNGKHPEWRKEEDEYLRRHYLFKSDAEIAEHLGRSVTGVQLRMKRYLDLPARSKMQDWPNLRETARRLGIPDSKVFRAWERRGLIEIHDLPLGRTCRVVYWPRMVRFAVNPMHWIYFDTDRVQDSRLRRLIERQKERWTDEWWTTGQVAAYHGVEAQDVQRNILLGKIKAVQWGNWRVLRSEATRPDLVFYKGKGSVNNRAGWTPEEDAFIVLARALGHSWYVVSRMMKYDYLQRAHHRFDEMHRHGLIAETISRHGLGVRYNAETGVVLADWQDEAHRRRFSAMATACERFQRGKPLSVPQSALVAGTFWAWASFYAQDEERQRTIDRWRYWSGNIHDATLRKALGVLRGWGVDPFADREVLPWQS